MTCEDKVKAVYPEAVLKFDLIRKSNKADWSTDGSHLGAEFLALGVWAGNYCLSFGGKYEYLLWRRAWKVIQKNLLKKLEE